MFCRGSKNTQRIRKARIHDGDDILALGEELRLESYVYYPPIETDLAWRNFRNVVENPDLFCAFVAEDRDGVFGWVQGFVSPLSIYSSRRLAMLDILYVRKSKRVERPFAALRLMKEFMIWGNSNAERMIVGTANGIHPERTEKLFLRLGFERFGVQYMKEA